MSRSAHQHIRPVDMKAALSRPPRPVRYRVEGFAQDGALTLLCGQADARKSWTGMQLCIDVQSGKSTAGLRVEQGTAVYVDGEMGEAQMEDRFRDAGLPHDAFQVVDVQGLDLGHPDGVDALRTHLAKIKARFVVIDSLRRLSPGKKENDSDDMAPLVGSLALMARQLDAAVVLIHHSGHGDGHFSRGSSAIVDQADAVFGQVVRGDTLELSCNPGRGGKFRFGRAPSDRCFRLAIGERPGVVVISADKKNTTTTPGKKTAADRYADRIRDLLAEAPGLTKQEVADRIGIPRDNQSFRTGWNRVKGDGGGDPLPRVPDTTTAGPPPGPDGPAAGDDQDDPLEDEPFAARPMPVPEACAKPAAHGQVGVWQMLDGVAVCTRCQRIEAAA